MAGKTDVTKPIRNLSLLHPDFRKKVIEIQRILNNEEIPLKIYETFRYPDRQIYVLKNGGSNAKPWQSYHQYGFAVDFVIYYGNDPTNYSDNKWSWDNKNEHPDWWNRMHMLGKKHGLTPIYKKNGKLFESAHLQPFFQDQNHADIQFKNGNYPPGGDYTWAKNLADTINAWNAKNGYPKAPPPPKIPKKTQQIRLDKEWLKDMQLPVDALFVKPNFSKKEYEYYIFSQEPMGLIRGALKSMRRIQKKK